MMLDVLDMEADDFIIVNLANYHRSISEEATTITRFIDSVARH